MSPEGLARLFHETYERLAPAFGYETRKDSAVPWEDVPEANKSLMIAVAGEVAQKLSAASQMPPHLKGHRFETHVAGPPTRPEGEEFTYQFCVRCGGCLQIVEGGLHPSEPVEPGTPWTYIIGPRYRGYNASTAETLRLSEFCRPKDLSSPA